MSGSLDLDLGEDGLQGPCSGDRHFLCFECSGSDAAGYVRQIFIRLHCERRCVSLRAFHFEWETRTGKLNGNAADPQHCRGPQT